MIYIGDTHGKMEALARMVRHELSPDEKKFQLGDMGLGFRGVLLANLDNFRFIRGNHDDPAACRAHPNYAGEYGYDPEEQLFFLGGAWSIDWRWRIEGVSWWRDEELSWAELNDALELYARIKPRIVATHEAPSEAARQMLMGIIAPRSGSGPTNVVKGEDYGYYKDKLGCVNTRTSQVLQRMFDIHRPEH